MREGERTFDLLVRHADNYRTDPEAIGSALMATPAGPIVPLSQLGSIIEARGPNMITRENVQRKIVVSANVAERDVIGAVTQLQEHIATDIDLGRRHPGADGMIEKGGIPSGNLPTLLILDSLSPLKQVAGSPEIPSATREH